MNSALALALTASGANAAIVLGRLGGGRLDAALALRGAAARPRAGAVREPTRSAAPRA